MRHSAPIPAPPAPSRTRVETVMDTLRARIASRALMPGARVPSIRMMADALGVSKSTVVDAYERLASEGVLVARRGSGFYVSGHAPPLALAELGPRLDRELDPLWLSRQSLEAAPTSVKPGCGWLPSSWLPDESLRRALRAVSRDEADALTDYATPLGLPALRQQLAWRLAQHGVHAEPAQIMLTDGGTHALDLVCRLLLEPGDTVVLDDPCYFNFQALLRAHRARIVSVPFTPNGPDLVRFEQVLAEHRPRLYITNAALHNPTGATLAPPVAHRLLTLAAEHGLLIVEDDIFADFESTPAPRLAAFDGLSRVVSIGSFSKTLSAAIRCGYVAARPEWIDALVDLKLATSFGNAQIGANVVHRLLIDGTYRRHLDSLRARLADAMGETIRRLARAGLAIWTEPRGGLFVWAELPDGLDAARVARHALDHDVVLAPGNVFSASRSATSYLRFNVSRCKGPAVFDALARAMEATRVVERGNLQTDAVRGVLTDE
ncbi:PLP-dependent aminotransferase family protein [Burkholderia cenocepacia]|uniref:aminotransferase-like domain-containing protein n=1 Tax=Burkholderia cenocepacia TaxID=95486 RepID=UPI0006AC6FD0|nr:PLP-dependent aminotransferase family protein [Burkholderia cenocepacia]KOR20332.1 GntR family transcriptional regulator [Burkholderia cenocepacia]MBR7980745.1 PLP-dependent aminotransferase family protein [Burkholderia cenocepacia]MBR8410664.1 PLP-dependent aminotransferase family protein [Burkholderia cenocepacia]MDS0851561.1 PLP-dependent aminotransferase family protein [Burkholderia cenocepacia]HDR9804042.1 PLP-dependent aminotransferase family protein [Burkholderia cenocepacia]